VNDALNILDRGRARTEPPRKGFLRPERAEVAGCSHFEWGEEVTG
jgi:hypothetical protein